MKPLAPYLNRINKGLALEIGCSSLFSKRTLKKLLDTAGFKVLQVSSLKNSYPFDYWLKLLLKDNVLGSVLRRFINGIGIGKLAFPISAGNIFAIASK